MADHNIRFLVSSGRWKQLRAIDQAYGIKPAEFIRMMVDAYPGDLLALAANMDMAHARSGRPQPSTVIDKADVIGLIEPPSGVMRTSEEGLMAPPKPKVLENLIVKP